MTLPTESTPAQPQFVLLHGAGLGRWIWDDVTEKLQFTSKALDLPGRSNSPEMATINLAQCVDAVVGALEPQSILVGHSFSAPVALAAAARNPDLVCGIILIGGVIPESGNSFVSTLPLFQRVLMSAYIKSARKGVNLPASLIKNAYCNDLGTAKTAMVLANTVREVPGFYLDKLDWSTLPDEMPCVYIRLLDDTSLTQAQQDKSASRLPLVEFVSLKTGHLPMVSQPEMLANVLNRVGASFAKVEQRALLPA